MRQVILAAALMNASTASAATLDCPAFKDRLAAAIHEGGDGVALPQWGEPTTLSVTKTTVSSFKSVVGLSGELSCEPSGAFYSLEATAAIDEGVDTVENGRRIGRAVALLSAGICAVEPMAPKQCRATALRLSEAAYKSFLAAKVRGEQEPSGGDETILARSSVSTSVNDSLGEMAITVRKDVDKPVPLLAR